MKYLILLLMTIMTLGLQQAYAAFPATQKPAAAPPSTTEQLNKDLREKVNAAIDQLTNSNTRPSDEGEEALPAPPGIGLVSLLLGIFGVFAMVVAAVGLPVIGTFGFLALLAAIITGAVGIRRNRHDGLARAGMIIGIVGLSLLLLLLIIALALLASWYK